jgi:hypothetical protein
VTIVGLGWLLVISSACASKPHQAKKDPSYSYPSPPVADASELLRREAVTERARELVRKGEYKTTSESRRVAEQENPPVTASNDAAQWGEYARWKKQRAAQAKFEGELEKMNREQ